MMQIVTLIQSAKDVAPIALSLAVFFVTFSFNRWQKKLGKQQLRNRLYDRRLSVYLLFRELLQLLPEGGDDEINAVFQRVKFALLEVPFLFEDNPHLLGYLEKIYTRVAEVVINNKEDLKVNPLDVLYDKDNQRASEARERIRQYDAAKLKIQDEYVTQLPVQFGAFLKLTDFSK